MNFYVVEEYKTIKTSIKGFDDIGPEFNLSVKVSSQGLERDTMTLHPCSLAYSVA